MRASTMRAACPVELCLSVFMVLLFASFIGGCSSGNGASPAEDTVQDLGAGSDQSLPGVDVVSSTTDGGDLVETNDVDVASSTPDGGDLLEANDVDVGQPSADGCPEEHPWIALPESYSQFDCELPAGAVCSWPAEGCAAGEKPDNVCTCTEYPGGKLRFDCETPFHNCLPLQGVEENPDELKWRRLPEHRPEAAPCAAVVSPRPDMTCEESQTPMGNPDPECVTDEDCGEGGLCLDSYYFGGETLCQCHTSGCQQDDDCGDGALCLCGVVANGEGTPCGSFWDLPCGHQCLPSTCRTDADCGEGGYCSPSTGICGLVAKSYHCHHPEAPECLTNWECFDENCVYSDGEGWICEEIPMCD